VPHGFNSKLLSQTPGRNVRPGDLPAINGLRTRKNSGVMLLVAIGSDGVVRSIGDHFRPPILRIDTERAIV
jgi:hypothetical protein